MLSPPALEAPQQNTHAYASQTTLSQLFELLYGQRTIDRSGYIRYQRWRLYGDEPVAQYAVAYSADGRTFEGLAELRPFPAHPSPQPRLFDEPTMREVEWRKVIRLPAYVPRNVPPGAPGLLQQQLFA